MSDRQMRRQDRRQARRQTQRARKQERRHKRRFDPMQKAEDFTLDPAPRTEARSIERQYGLIYAMAKHGVQIASKPPGRQLLETVLELPEATESDVGRLIILRRGPGIADQMYIGMQLDDDEFAWVEMTTEIAAQQTTWVRHIATTDPTYAAADSSGNFYVTKLTNHMQKFSSSGVVLATTGNGVADTNIVGGDNTLNQPLGVAWAPAGRYPADWLAVANRDAHMVSVYAYQHYNLVAGPLRLVTGTLYGEPRAATTGTAAAGVQGTSGSTSAHLNQPRGVAIDGSGYVYIADMGNNRIVKWLLKTTFSPPEKTATHIATIGAGVPSSPRGIAVSPTTNVIYISDYNNNRVLGFSQPSGVNSVNFGSAGTGDGQFNGPDGLAFDPNGKLHVVDRGNDRVQVFEPDGTFIKKYGSGPGSGSGQLNDPIGIAISSQGVIFVCDFGNNRISVWV